MLAHVLSIFFVFCLHEAFDRFSAENIFEAKHLISLVSVLGTLTLLLAANSVINFKLHRLLDQLPPVLHV